MSDDLTIVMVEGGTVGYYMNQGKLFAAPVIKGALDRDLEMMVDYWDLNPEELEEAFVALDLLLERNE